MGPGPGGMHTALSWKAETSALGKIKRIADRKLGIFHAQHGHVSGVPLLNARCQSCCDLI